MERRSWILVAVCAAAALILMAAWVLLPPEPGPPCNGCGPIGTALALAQPSESVQGGLHLYNFSVEAASSGLSWADISPEIQTSGGGPVSTTSLGWNVTVFDIARDPVGYFTIQSTGVWSVGGGLAVESGEWLLVTSPGATSLSGDVLVLSLGVGFVGTISLAIP
jgi:hypothetical protein